MSKCVEVKAKDATKETCHDCGLEDFVACQESAPHIHRSSMPSDEPCSICTRNPETGNKPGWIDFYSEGWVCECSRKPEYTMNIKNPDLDERALLFTLEAIRATKKGKQIR